MLYTIETLDNDEWPIYAGTPTARGPSFSSLNPKDCVITGGIPGGEFTPPAAHFDSNSIIEVKALRLTFPGAPGVVPGRGANIAFIEFLPLKKDGSSSGVPIYRMVEHFTSCFWEWKSINGFFLPAFENGYWLARARFLVSLDFLAVQNDFIGAKYSVRVGALVESSGGVYVE